MQPPTETPRHTHDCDRCVFLGAHAEYDLYFCAQGGFDPTVIARFGEQGDYKSGMVFAHPGTVLGEAKRRAIERGLMPAQE